MLEKPFAGGSVDCSKGRLAENLALRVVLMCSKILLLVLCAFSMLPSHLYWESVRGPQWEEVAPNLNNLYVPE